MPKYNEKYQQDRILGKYNEQSQKKYLEKLLSCELNDTNRYHVFDYINKKERIVCELKSRRIRGDKFHTTMIGLNKIDKGMKYLEKDYQVFLFFKYTDGLYYIEMNKNFKDLYEIRKGGRKDRGFDEIKDYMYIPISKLEKI